MSTTRAGDVGDELRAVNGRGVQALLVDRNHIGYPSARRTFQHRENEAATVKHLRCDLDCRPRRALPVAW
jgi:hypothetical protein